MLDLIKRAACRSVYYHLPEYMERWWILGADSLARNADNPTWGYVAFQRARSRSRLYQWLTKHVAIRLHHVLRSDTDRHLHDHPAWNISIVLKGGYWEEVPACAQRWNLLVTDDPQCFGVDACEVTRRVWRGPGSIVFRRASDRHRLVLPSGQTSWSIFIVGRKTQSWGFYTAVGKVPWRKYLGIETETV